MSDPAQRPLPSVSRVFINRVDTYLGRILAQHLGNCLVPVEPDDDVIPDEDAVRSTDLTSELFLEDPGPDGNYHIAGTWREHHPPADCCNVPSGRNEAPVVPAAKTLVRFDSDQKIEDSLRAADAIILHCVDEDGNNNLLTDCLHLMDKLIHMPRLEPPQSKCVLLISTCMTWANTKLNEDDEIESPPMSPVKSEIEGKAADPESEEEEDEDDEVEALTEDEYRRRKCPPAYRPQYQLEQEVLRLGRNSKGRIIATVLNTGLLFGCGENVLHPFFKQAWENASKSVEFPGPGRNRVPMLHVRDLCQVVQAMCENPLQGFMPRYVLAVDGVLPPLIKVVRAISKTLGNGELTPQPAESFPRNKTEMDLLCSDNRLAGSTVRENLSFQWVAGEGFADNIDRIVDEYRRFRNLTPIKLLVTGKPLIVMSIAVVFFVGKTTLARRLADWYQLPYLDSEAIINDALKQLRRIRDAPPAVKSEDTDEEEELDEDDLTPAQRAGRTLETIEESRDENGTIGLEHITQFVQARLLTKECQNKGYVLDGYPATHAQAIALFAPVLDEGETEKLVEEQEDEDKPDGPPMYADKLTAPDIILQLDLTDEALKLRVMDRPELSLVDNTARKTLEDEFERRLKAYAENMQPVNIINFFDEVEIPVVQLDGSKDADASMEITLQTALTRIGPPHNFGPTEADRRKTTLEEERTDFHNQKSAEVLSKKLLIKHEQERRSARCDQWGALLKMQRQQKQDRLQGETLVSRAYLQQNLLPVVQDGLTALAQTRPADPIDYFAEFLLQRRNPLKIHGSLDADAQLRVVSKSV